VTSSPAYDMLRRMLFRILGGTRGAGATFILEAPDGTILLRGGAFDGQATCLDAVRAAVRHLADAGRLDVVPEGDGLVEIGRAHV